MSPLPEDCIPCINRMAESTAMLAGFDEQAVQNIRAWVQNKLDGPWQALNGPQIATAITDRIRGITGDGTDPYATLKADSNTKMLEALPYLRSIITDASDTFTGALRVAAAGNIIDFGAKDHAEIDLDAELEQIPFLKLGGEGLERLRRSLEHADMVLYIGDNAGEIVCDRVCIEALKRLYPAVMIVYAVRGVPVLNDVTMADAVEVGLTGIVPVASSGSRYPGTILKETNLPFQELFASADCIIAKGQGNYETLYRAGRENLFHVFRVKCAWISRASGLPVGTLAVV